MKVHISGDTPMERLTNFAKKLVAVPKGEVTKLEKEWRQRKRRKRKRL